MSGDTETPVVEGPTRIGGYLPRRIPPEEWGRPDLESIASVLAAANPELSILVGVEDRDGRIVAAWLAMNTVHLEGVWIDERLRGKSMVPQLLLTEMKLQLLEAMVPGALTIAQTPEVLTLALKAGFTIVPGTLLQLDLTTPIPEKL